MNRTKQMIMLFFIIGLLLFIPNISNASDISVSRNIYSNNGSMKFTFTGLTLDKTHLYEFGLTKAKAEQVETWYSIQEAEFTSTTATIDIITTTKDLRNVINAVDTGYITIKDKTSDTIVLQPYSVDLKIPFLQVTNYTVIPNGKQFGSSNSDTINIALRNANNSLAYYQYEKITDQNIIDKYKEIKAKKGDFMDLQNILKTTPPTSGWNSWNYWNGHYSDGLGGYGRTQNTISVPDTGLYYMWVYFSGKNDIKNIYGYALVDNLAPVIALESISLPKTEKLELGKTLTLKLTFNPSGATNKIVTWSSSDETVATVDNAGKVTSKKLGSTIITVISQDGNKKATCTVTVTNASSGGSSSSETSSGSTTNIKKYDSTTATGSLPRAGLGIGLIVIIAIVLGISIFVFFRCRNLKDV